MNPYVFCLLIDNTGWQENVSHKGSFTNYMLQERKDSYTNYIPYKVG